MTRVARVLLTLAFITVTGRAAFGQLTPDLDPRISQLVGQVSEDRLTIILKKLETFGTRNTMSSIDAPGRGIGSARQWIFDEMQGYSPKLQVSYDTYRIAKQGRITRDVDARNIMAVLRVTVPAGSMSADTTTPSHWPAGSGSATPARSSL